MAILLTAEDVHRATAVKGVLEALDSAHMDEHLGNTVITERFSLRFESGWMRLMAAALPTLGVFGYKEFHVVHGELRIQISLFDLESGELLACMDGNYLTVLRTSATAALAAARLAPDASVVGIIGSGAEARMQATILAQLLEITQIRVHSPREDSRNSFARDLSPKLGIHIEPCSDGAAAAADADTIIVATNTGGRGPAFFADWIPDYAHISSTGSTLPEERELDTAVWKYPELIVVDRIQALEEAGDAIAAANAGTLDTKRVITLAQLWGRSPDCALPHRTLYKSVGSPLQDIAVAACTYRNAKEQGLGTNIRDFLSTKRSIPIPPRAADEPIL